MEQECSFVVDLQCFPSFNYFKSIAHSTHIIIEAWENHQKLTYKNRFEILGSNGIVTFSVPLKGGREQRKLVKEVEIDYTNDWTLTFSRTIHSCYAKASFYPYYVNELLEIVNKRHQYLFSLNFEIFQFLHKSLKMNAPYNLSAKYEAAPTGVVDLRNKILPKHRIIHGAGLPEYPQVFASKFGFVPNLSVLDLLFNEGPNAGEYLNM